MVIPYKCSGCGTRCFKLDKEDHNVMCKNCTRKVLNGEVKHDRTRNTQSAPYNPVLAGNMETVADVWADRELLPNSEGRNTTPTNDGNAEAERTKEIDNSHV